MYVTASEMNLSYGVPRGVIPERILQGFVEGLRLSSTPRPVQHKIERGGYIGIRALSLPVFQTVTPEAPELREAAGDFEPVVTNEEEVVRALLYPGELGVTELRRDVETEDVSEDFWRYVRDG